MGLGTLALLKARTAASKSSGLSSTIRIGSMDCMESSPQGKADCSSTARRRLDPRYPTVPLHDFLHERQTRAHPAAKVLPGVQPLEHPEHDLVMFGRDADPVVPHA